ncbi:MAG: rhodanese-like domain-containing protein [Microthrixaceae bacterium]|nr:rhodanese-like domain-containing protein [Microthrixaceae bacterium]MCO5313251.1 rhodanese-like domain-containing protein [Microthrixaceae bacterium]
MTVTVRPADLARLRTEHPTVRLIDVRTPGEFAVGHIDGSYNVPLPNLAEHREELTRTTDPVVLICQSGRRAEAAETQLREAGLDTVHVLDGGIEAWSAGGHALRHLDGPQPWTLERQVRLVAGGIVAVSILLSIIWPHTRWVAGALGLGLVFAAVTNTCAMGMMLMKLPYNRRNAGTCDMPTIAAALTGATPAPVDLTSQPKLNSTASTTSTTSTTSGGVRS